MSVIDIREMDKKMADETRYLFIKNHMKCHKNDLDAHDWTRHEWIEEVKAWLWGPCTRCGRMRLVQVYGNYAEMDMSGYVYDVLISDDDFADWKLKAKTALRCMETQQPLFLG